MTPSFATYMGSMPRSSDAPSTSGITGMEASRTVMPTAEARASSFSAEATPPRVASRIERRLGPGGVEERVGNRPEGAGV